MPRVNEDIEVDRVRLIDPDGEQIGVVTRDRALEIARDRDMDLVEVAPDKSPPVCRLGDEERFTHEDDDDQSPPNRRELREVRVMMGADEPRVKAALDGVRRRLEEGYTVKLTVLPAEGRPERGEGTRDFADELVARLGSESHVRDGPRPEGRRQVAFLRRSD